MNKVKVLMMFILVFMFIGGCCNNPNHDHGKKNEKTKKIIKEGKIIDFDYTGDGLEIQLKFDDGDVVLCYRFVKGNKKIIRIGQTGVLYKETATHENCGCMCCKYTWEITDHIPIREMDVKTKE